MDEEREGDVWWDGPQGRCNDGHGAIRQIAAQHSQHRGAHSARSHAFLL
jgi:hypothetical protein